MADTTRTTFREALLKSPNAATRALADVLVGTAGAPALCWGDLADYVRDHFANDEDALALWTALVDVGDRRPLLLFLQVHRARSTILRALLSDPARVPPIVQCALVSMPETEPFLAAASDGLAPAARELAASPPDVRAREREVYGAHTASLGALRASPPLSQDAIARHLAELPSFFVTHPSTEPAQGPQPTTPEVPQAPRPGAPP